MRLIVLSPQDFYLRPKAFNICVNFSPVYNGSLIQHFFNQTVNLDDSAYILFVSNGILLIFLRNRLMSTDKFEQKNQSELQNEKSSLIISIFMHELLYLKSVPTIYKKILKCYRTYNIGYIHFPSVYTQNTYQQDTSCMNQ